MKSFELTWNDWDNQPLATEIVRAENMEVAILKGHALTGANSVDCEKALFLASAREVFGIDIRYLPHPNSLGL